MEKIIVNKNAIKHKSDLIPRILQRKIFPMNLQPIWFPNGSNLIIKTSNKKIPFVIEINNKKWTILWLKHPRKKLPFAGSISLNMALAWSTSWLMSPEYWVVVCASKVLLIGWNKNEFQSLIDYKISFMTISRKNISFIQLCENPS